MNVSDQLNEILNNLQGVWLESSLMIGAIILLIVGLFKPSKAILKGVFALILIAAFLISRQRTLSGAIILDSLFIDPSLYPFAGLLVISCFFVLVFRREKHVSEFYFLILSMLVGSLFMIKANNLLIVYLAIELASFSAYILTNFSFERKSFEAGIKYLLFGATSSAIMLFGMATLYGSVGTIYFTGWDVDQFSSLAPQVGLLMLFLGLFFKISIFPSHIWVPATYQTAPVDAAAYMSVVPKLAGLILLKRLFSLGIIYGNSLLFQAVLILGIVTLVIGTLGAFSQQNARRMISFGAIAHSGFLLPFVFIQTDTALDSFWYYSCIYVIMNFAVFYLLSVYESQSVENIKDYGIKKVEPWIGVPFLFVLISLVGIPPLAGFTSKFFLFTTLWEYYQTIGSSPALWYLITAVLVTVGSLFFYLRIPKEMFLSSQTDNQTLQFGFSTKMLATLFCIALLLLFFVPELVMEAKQLLNFSHE